MHDYEPSFLCRACRHECRQHYPYYELTCSDCERDCRCDDLEKLAHYQWDEQWAGPVRCCVRAGLDMASAPSAGVVGFTAGDLRAMYPEGVPDWVIPPDERLRYWLSNEMNGTFAELPDSAGIVL